jgi:hypothetical protein
VEREKCSGTVRGNGKKKEKLFIVRKNERLAKKREKLVVAPLDMRWSVGGYASDLWWRQASGNDGWWLKR